MCVRVHSQLDMGSFHLASPDEDCGESAPICFDVGNPLAPIKPPPGQNGQYMTVVDNSKKKGAFDFPILKPANIFQLILGHDADIITYTSPVLDVDIRVDFHLTFMPGVLDVSFIGRLTAMCKVHAGSRPIRGSLR